MARVLVAEPFYGGSHKAFLDGLVRHSRHEFELLTLPDGEWRRRMRRGAQELAPAAMAATGTFDLLIVTDMLDLPAFLALTRPRFASTPVLCYFHENQFTYPRLRGTKFNSWFGQINYLSACAADYVAFNSQFHREDFLGALRALARTSNGWLVESLIAGIEARSAVLPVGVELAWLDAHEQSRRPREEPLVLWNHRWEFDKAPAVFARAITVLADEGLAFQVALAGDPGPNPARELMELGHRAPGRIAHSGYAASREAYAELLWNSAIVASTARHEFFGVGMAEALYCGCVPVAPARYNYPALIPREWHERCLFEDEAALVHKLRRVITDPIGETAPGRASAARFAWEKVAEAWDDAIEMMANAPRIADKNASIANMCVNEVCA